MLQYLRSKPLIRLRMSHTGGGVPQGHDDDVSKRPCLAAVYAKVTGTHAAMLPHLHASTTFESMSRQGALPSAHTAL